MKRKIFVIVLALVIISVYYITSQDIIIPTNSIRLRIIPNSNEPVDINIKEQVKTYLSNTIYETIKNVSSTDEARTIINNNIDNINEEIKNIFASNNYDMTYNVNFGYNYFPTKMYRGKTYSEGYYESLVVSIGEASGDNWWCVLYPNLCLIKDTKNIKIESYFKKIFQNIIDK